MAIKEIILHVGDGGAASCVNLVGAIAKAHGARITAFIEGGGAEGKAAAIKDAAGGAEVESHDFDGRQDELVVHHSLHCDLIVISQAHADLASELIVGSGRPVLVVPIAGKFPSVGKNVLIAWDGTREASRATHDALPLIADGAKVKLYFVNPAHAGDEPATDIASHLARHGINAEADHTFSRIPPSETAVFGARSLKVGDLLLSAAADMGADMLVMGGYSHSRVREMMTGGVTRSILRHMTVPVLMSH